MNVNNNTITLFRVSTTNRSSCTTVVCMSQQQSGSDCSTVVYVSTVSGSGCIPVVCVCVDNMRIWLEHRCACVCVNNKKSWLFNSCACQQQRGSNVTIVACVASTNSVSKSKMNLTKAYECASTTKGIWCTNPCVSTTKRSWLYCVCQQEQCVSTTKHSCFCNSCVHQQQSSSDCTICVRR